MHQNGEVEGPWYIRISYVTNHDIAYNIQNIMADKLTNGPPTFLCIIFDESECPSTLS